MLFDLNNLATAVTVAESEGDMTTYLLPTVFAGKLPIEYRIVERKRDMRTRFCRENEKCIIDRDTLNEYIREYNIKVKEDRVIMKDGRQAIIFSVLVR